jgi:putative ABC transport system substrate-binding protein
MNKNVNKRHRIKFRAGFNRKSKIQNLKCVVLATLLLATVSFADAQQRSKIARVGVLRLDTPSGPAAAQSLGDFRQGLSNLGYTEGQNIALEIRWADDKLDRLPILATELVQLKVDVIVTHGPPGVRAAKEATNTIPIVMGRMDDVVERGFVASLARPGGNITGLSFQTGELSGKWLEILTEVLPRMSRVAVLRDEIGTTSHLRTIEEAGRSLRLQLEMLKVRGPGEFEQAFETLRKRRAEGLLILGSPVFTAHRARLANLSAKIRLPAIYYHEGFTEAGGLLAYGPKQSEFSWHRAAIFVDKILKGAKPADLPVEQPTKFEFIVNLKTAKLIGLTIPPNVLARADKVIR